MHMIGSEKKTLPQDFQSNYTIDFGDSINTQVLNRYNKGKKIYEQQIGRSDQNLEPPPTQL